MAVQAGYSSVTQTALSLVVMSWGRTEFCAHIMPLVLSECDCVCLWCSVALQVVWLSSAPAHYLPLSHMVFGYNLCRKATQSRTSCLVLLPQFRGRREANSMFVTILKRFFFLIEHFFRIWQGGWGKINSFGLCESELRADTQRGEEREERGRVWLISEPAAQQCWSPHQQLQVTLQEQSYTLFPVWSWKYSTEENIGSSGWCSRRGFEFVYFTLASLHIIDLKTSKTLFSLQAEFVFTKYSLTDPASSHLIGRKINMKRKKAKRSFHLTQISVNPAINLKSDLWDYGLTCCLCVSPPPSPW